MRKTESQDALDRALTDLYQTDIPAGYPAAWRDAVKREESPAMKSTAMPQWLKRTVLPLAAAIVLITGTLITGALNPTPSVLPRTAQNTASTSGNYKTMDIAEDTAANDFGMYATESAVFASAPTVDYAVDGELAAGTGATSDRKIVRTIDLTIATSDYDSDYAAIITLAENAGGYIAGVNAYEAQVESRTAYFDLRIPSDKLDVCLSGLESIGRVTNRNEATTDLTTQYSDTALRLQTQQSKMTRLQELLAQAETVEDLLAIESEIADTQYQIDSLESSLRSIDRRVDYTAVSVYLREQTPADSASAASLSIGERIRNGLKATLTWLKDFFANMLVFLIAVSPVLAGIIILWILIHIIRKHRNSDK